MRGDISLPKILLHVGNACQYPVVPLALFRRQFFPKAGSRERQHIQESPRAAPFSHFQSLALAVQVIKQIGGFGVDRAAAAYEAGLSRLGVQGDQAKALDSAS